MPGHWWPCRIFAVPSTTRPSRGSLLRRRWLNSPQPRRTDQDKRSCAFARESQVAQDNLATRCRNVDVDLRLVAAEQPTAPGENDCNHYNQENYEDGNNFYA